MKGLNLCKIIYEAVLPKKKESQYSPVSIDFMKEAASNLISKKLSSDEPVMICRFGASELFSMTHFLNIKSGSSKYLKYIVGDIENVYYKESVIKSTFQMTGIFPVNEMVLERFYKLMIEDTKCIDVLGCWLKDETYFVNDLKKVVKVRLEDLEPYYHQNPWSEALTGKKVLVVHPFAASIEKQYLKRELLFADKRVLPEFELKTIKAVQSLGENKTNFKDWFCALDFMKDQIDSVDFDVAIIGCGAYGFPLAAHVKRKGKKAVHLGGATQALFGIIGKRWEENEVSRFINQHWSRPLPSEGITNAVQIEGGCYW